MFDESPDKKGRKIINILIGELNEMEIKKPYLIDTLVLETVNSENIRDVINFLIVNVVKETKFKNNFKVLISDKAAYAVKSSKLLNLLFPQLIHITCSCHALHNFASFLKGENKLCDKFDKEFKKFSKKNSKKKKLKIKTGISLPKFSIATRWGSSISFLISIYDSYQIYKIYIDELPKTEKIRILFNDMQFIQELIFINEFRDLPLSTTLLENSNLTLAEQYNIIFNFKEKIKSQEYIAKFDSILNSDPGYNFFSNYTILNYCPLTSVWVERSFSSYKYIFNDLRRSLDVDTIKMLLFFYFNKNII